MVTWANGTLNTILKVRGEDWWRENADKALAEKKNKTPGRSRSCGRSGTPGRTLKGTPGRNLRGTPRRNLRGTPVRNLRGTPGRNLRGTPVRNNLRGTPGTNVRRSSSRTINEDASITPPGGRLGE